MKPGKSRCVQSRLKEAWTLAMVLVLLVLVVAKGKSDDDDEVIDG